jgi:preprotein translocase subunit SecG
MTTFLLALFIVICILLIVVVLLQKGRGGGLSGAFGGGMTSSAFGTRTGDVFTWVTIVLTGLFLLLAIGNTYIHRPKEIDLYPVFSPPSGPIEKETAVTIQGQRTRDELTIRYTLDGSDPTERSAQYIKEPVRVQPGQTLSARIYRRSRAMPVQRVTYNRPEAPVPVPPPTTSTAPTTTTAPAPASGPERPASAPNGRPATGPAAAPTTGPIPAPAPAPSPTRPATTTAP